MVDPGPRAAMMDQGTPWEALWRHKRQGVFWTCGVSGALNWKEPAETKVSRTGKAETKESRTEPAGDLGSRTEPAGALRAPGMERAGADSASSLDGAGSGADSASSWDGAGSGRSAET